MQEWFNWQSWKDCVPKGTASSNLALSAIEREKACILAVRVNLYNLSYNMLKIYLARHGQDEDNASGILNGHRDFPLTEVGVNQAQTLADKIKNADINFDIIYSSPFKRTLQTAKIIAENTDIKNNIVRLDLLKERNFGVMTGKPAKDIEILCAPDILKTKTITYFLSPKGAETFPDLCNRAKEIIDFVTKKHKNGSVLLVTSGDIGKMIYASYYNLD